MQKYCQRVIQTCLNIAECSYILCKNIANECNTNLFEYCRVQLYFMQKNNSLIIILEQYVLSLHGILCAQQIGRNFSFYLLETSTFAN